MKTLYLSLIALLCSVAPTFAENPYLPVTQKRKVTFTYIYGTGGGSIKETVSHYTGEMKEVDGKKYYISKNWVVNKQGEKVYPSESFARVDKEGNVFVINGGSKKETLTIPAVSKLKEGYSWTTKMAGMEVLSKVISMNGEIALKNFNMNDLVVVEQTVGKSTKMRSYFQKDKGPVAVSTISDKGEEKFMFYWKEEQ